MKALQVGVFVSVVLCTPAAAHDLERTTVTLTLSEDGSFVLDISNDPGWLLLRLESFARGRVPMGMTPTARDTRLRQLGPVFIDRVVLFVDGREIRPSSAEYIPPRPHTDADGLPLVATFRLRGRMPLDARSLRWLYGLVIDPYPLVVRRADGRTEAELIEGSNWSGTLDLAGQFKATRIAGIDYTVLLVAVFAIVVWLRMRHLTRHRGSTGVIPSN